MSRSTRAAPTDGRARLRSTGTAAVGPTSRPATKAATLCRSSLTSKASVKGTRRAASRGCSGSMREAAAMDDGFDQFAPLTDDEIAASAPSAPDAPERGDGELVSPVTPDAPEPPHL